MTPQDYRCPQCGQIDSVSKVSALVSSGTASYSRTNLASRLSPPSEPVYEDPRSGSGCSIGCFAMLPLFCLGIFIFLIYGYSTLTPQDKADTPPSNLLLLLGTPGLIGLISLIILIAILVRNSNEVKEKKEAFASAHPRWQRARSLWNEVYYCSRNDIVFLLPSRPGERKVYAPASEMERLLYEYS